MKAAWFVVLALGATSAWADASVAGSFGHVDGSAPEVGLVLGTRAEGVFGTLPRGTGVWDGELLFSPWDATLEVRGAAVWQLWQSGFWALSAQAGATLLSSTAMDVDVGVGPFGGVSLGFGTRVLEGFIGAEGGLEAFARGPAIRFPARLQLGARLSVGHLALALLGRAGADFEPHLFYTGRAEAFLTAGYRF